MQLRPRKEELSSPLNQEVAAACITERGCSFPAIGALQLPNWQVGS